jgi:formylglycine-generating enzyme required for sulfatase activity
MPKKLSIWFIAMLALLIVFMDASAEEDPPVYAFYFPLITKPPPGDMVYIPAGPFMMGCDPEHNAGVPCQTYEFSLQVKTMEAYYIDRYEVTNAQYAACVAAGACFNFGIAKTIATRPDYYDNPAYANYPALLEDTVILDYCAWFGKRLPHETEWEKAARGSNDTRAYPWGDAPPTCNQANFAGCVGDTVPVGSYPAGVSPYGVMDMAGNADEWNDGSYYYVNHPAFNFWHEYGTVNGGDWNSDGNGVRVAARVPRIGPQQYAGLRCVISAP